VEFFPTRPARATISELYAVYDMKMQAYRRKVVVQKVKIF
jgi:hypothetical protein